MKTGVEILEEPGGDLAEPVELIEHAGEKGLVEHGRGQGVGDLVAGDIRDEDAESTADFGELGGGGVVPRLAGLTDSAVDVVPLVEVEIDDVVAAGGAVEKGRIRRRHRWRRAAAAGPAGGSD